MDGSKRDKAWNMYPTGENLLSAEPYWVYIQGQFSHGTNLKPYQGDPDIARTRIAIGLDVPVSDVVILNPRSPITFCATERNTRN